MILLTVLINFALFNNHKMSISERKEREKQELKRRILQAAGELFLKKGYEQTSMRNIAEKIEYSPTTIYLYYKDKDAIFHELHSEGFAILRDRVQVLAAVADPMERLKAMGRIYMEFAMENQEMYSLMFIMKGPVEVIEKKGEDWVEGQTTFDALKNVIDDCKKSGYFKGRDTEEMAFMIWASMHGMCALEISNRCKKVLSEDLRDGMMQKGLAILSDILDSVN